MHKPNERNPALAPLDVLVGEWQMELSNAAFLADPTAVIRGSVSFDWVQHGAFLLMRMGNKPPAAPAALWLIGRDEASANYTVLYYDNRNKSRVYDMSLTEGVWRMWREAPGFWQRFEGEISQDGDGITAYWEKSSDGSQWEHDFDVRYTKLGVTNGEAQSGAPPT